MELVFFGDSITFGYDPRLGTSGRFDGQTRWTARLSAALGAQEINFSACGLCVPQGAAIDRYRAELAAHPGAGAVLVMFGTNDILKGGTLDQTGAHLERFLGSIKEACDSSPLVCLAPPNLTPGAWTDPQTIRLSEGLAQVEQAAAAAAGCLFIDTAQARADMAFDGVHPSAAGHAALAQTLTDPLRSILERSSSC